MWGAKLHKKRELLEGLLEPVFQSGQNKTNTYQDQDSLAEIVWPIAKYDVVSYYTIRIRFIPYLTLKIYACADGPRQLPLHKYKCY